MSHHSSRSMLKCIGNNVKLMIWKNNAELIE
jgi:hypothetical protein